MATRARRRDTDSAERLRALTRRAYLATGGHLELEDEPPISVRTARRAEFDEIIRGQDGGYPAARAASRPAERPPERVRWRVSVRAAVAAVIVLGALTGVVVVRSLVQVDPPTVPLPVAATPVLEPAAGAPSDAAAPPDAAGPADVPAGTAGESGQQPATAPDDPPATEVVVHVAGAVAEPGIVTVASGARVADVVERAGGPTADAELGGINLARVVTDGEQVFVPEVGQGVPGAEAGAPAGTPDASGATGSDGAAAVDLNQADQAALETLPGVGPAIAQRILDWRATNGRFHSVDELDEVPGIGPATMERLRPRVTV
ncbi:ComEA family DNA-binding protein [Georgenia sp. MJ173]|uniref:ComEA family DNA-binding protein n=1 Tax=Georgenia sunbinii TaxID=3117728 RepID=UPI002F261EDB